MDGRHYGKAFLLLWTLTADTHAFQASDCSEDQLALPRLFSDGMVFQAAPEPTRLWGFARPDCGVVSVTRACSSDTSRQLPITRLASGFESSPRSDGLDLWEVTLPAMESGDHCEFTVNQGKVTKSLKVVYGDVWVCSGQSNMEMSLESIFNATQEAEELAKYSNIRMFRVLHSSEAEEQEDLKEAWDAWHGTDDDSELGEFSAVCLFYARYLTDMLGSDKVFGLVETAWGGTRIEPWMPQDAIDKCGVAPTPDDISPGKRNGHLWNAMVHPLLRFPVKGVLWYQGESNVNHNRDLYNCTFPALIDSWSAHWQFSGNLLPFGFVQLANEVGPGVAEIRWHQTADMGVVPNAMMPSAFMAVALDTHDVDIHPRYKQIIAERLSLAGANMAYGQKELPTNGPYPSSMGTVGTTALLEYGLPFRYDNRKTSGFYVCCQETFGDCDSAVSGTWQSLDRSPESVVVEPDSGTVLIDLSGQCQGEEGGVPVGLAFLWTDTPVREYLGAPITSDDEFGLPAAPWKMELNMGM